MTSLAVSKFKATCLSVLEQVQRTGEPVLVTKRGVPLAQIGPPSPPKISEKGTFGCMAGSTREVGDLLEPLPPEAWGRLA